MSYSILTKRRLQGVVNDVAMPEGRHLQEMDFYNSNTFEMFMIGVWLAKGMKKRMLLYIAVLCAMVSYNKTFDRLLGHWPPSL